VVLALSDELHFGRAAARLHVVQSAVSQALKDLEVELGVALFDRSPRGVTITAAGVHFRDHALRAMDEIASGASAARRAARGEEGRLRVAFSAMATATALPRVVTRFTREAPNVQIELANTSSPAVVEAIARREADVGIVPEIRRYGALSFFELRRERLVAVLPLDHPLASGRRKTLAIRELDGQPMIEASARKEPTLQAMLRALLATHQVRPRVTFEFDEVETMLSMVAAGLGIGIVPASLARSFSGGVTCRSLTPKVMAGHFLVWDAKTISPAALRFVRLFQSEDGRAPRPRAAPGRGAPSAPGD
jgi:DNA-binding transcriptional LysR family regulator